MNVGCTRCSPPFLRKPRHTFPCGILVHIYTCLPGRFLLSSPMAENPARYTLTASVMVNLRQEASNQSRYLAHNSCSQHLICYADYHSLLAPSYHDNRHKPCIFHSSNSGLCFIDIPSFLNILPTSYTLSNPPIIKRFKCSSGQCADTYLYPMYCDE